MMESRVRKTGLKNRGFTVWLRMQAGSKIGVHLYSSHFERRHDGNAQLN